MTQRLTANTTEAFKTHANYIRAFTRLMAPRVLTPGGPLARLRTWYKSVPKAGGACPDPTAPFRSLRLAWSTELLLDLTGAALVDDELIRIANNWAVVQVYYLFYHATQALAQAKGFSRTANHPQTQKSFKDFWADRPIQLPPWCLARAGSKMANVAPGVRIDDSIHAWAACDDTSCWHLAAKALRTTRQYIVQEALTGRRNQLLKERKKTWHADEQKRLACGKRPRKVPTFPKPQLSAAEKKEIEAQVRASTVMDYLYRLRIRTNYEDAAMFTDGPETVGEAEEVRRNLSLLGSGTLLIHELALSDIVGPAAVIAQGREFIQTVAPSGGATSLMQRIPLIDAYRQ